MGTSADSGGGVGGAWTPYKYAATNFVKYGGGARAAIAMARFVAALGGASRAADGSAGGTAAGQGVAGVFAGLATEGLTPTLQRLGLGDLVGRSRYEVISALIDRIAGAGDSPEAQAARSAALDVLAEILPDGDSYDELADVSLDAADVRAALQLFVAAYVYNRAAEVIDERLSRLQDQQAAEQRDRELRDYIRAVVELRLQDLDPLTVDWNGDDGRNVIERVLRDVYRQLEAGE